MQVLWHTIEKSLQLAHLSAHSGEEDRRDPKQEAVAAGVLSGKSPHRHRHHPHHRPHVFGISSLCSTCTVFYTEMVQIIKL